MSAHCCEITRVFSASDSDFRYECKCLCVNCEYTVTTIVNLKCIKICQKLNFSSSFLKVNKYLTFSNFMVIRNPHP